MAFNFQLNNVAKSLPQYNAPVAPRVTPPTVSTQSNPNILNGVAYNNPSAVQTYGNSAATSPARQSYVNDLTSKFGNSNGTIYNKSTGQGYSDPASFFKDAGVSSFNGLKFDTQYQPGQTQSQATPPPATPPASGDSSSSSTQATANNPFTDYQQAIKDYITSLSTTNTDVSSAKRKYLDYVTNEKLGENALEGQGRGIPLDLVRGQQAKLGQQSELEASRLQGDVGIAQDAQTAAQQAAATQYGLSKDLFTAASAQQDKAQAAQKDAATFALDNKITTPFYNVGGTVYSTATGKAFSTPDQAFAAGVAKDFSNAPTIKKAVDPVNVSEGGALIDPTTGQVIYKNPKTFAPSTSGGTGTYVEGQNPAVDAWVKQINNGASKITDVPAALKNAVVQGLSSGSNEASSLVKDAFTSAKDLLDSFNSGNKFAVGGSSIFPVIPGTKSADFVKNFDNLKSLLSLDNVKYLKGQGQVSDAERQLLADASSKLSRSQSEGEFQKTLQGIVNTLQNKVTPSSSSSTAGDPAYQAYLKAIGQ